MKRWRVVRIHPITKARFSIPVSYTNKIAAERLAESFNWQWIHPENGLIFPLEVEEYELFKENDF